MTLARRAGLTVVVLAVAALAVLGLVRAAHPADLSRRAQVDAVAATLRCPTCNGLSIKDSSSALAAGARTTIEQQLAEGRSPDQIRQWFVDRYGPSVLLDPAPSGPGLLVWLLPAAALLAAAGLGWRWLRRGRRPAGEAEDAAAATAWKAFRAGELDPDDSPSGEALRAALLARAALDDDRVTDADIDDEQVRRAELRLGAAYRRYTARPLAGAPRRRGPVLPRRAVLLASAAGLLAVTGAAIVLAVHDRGGAGAPGGAPGSLAAATTPATGSGAPAAPGAVTPPPGWPGGMPQDAAGWVALGRAYDRAAQLPQAAAAYQMALRLQPGDDGVSLLRDDALVRSGSADQALADLQQLRSRHPDDPNVLLILGLAQHQTGSADAAATLRRFLELAPDSPAAPGVRKLLGAG